MTNAAMAQRRGGNDRRALHEEEQRCGLQPTVRKAAMSGQCLQANAESGEQCPDRAMQGCAAQPHNRPRS
jgi:hypothetical protein